MNEERITRNDIEDRDGEKVEKLYTVCTVLTTALEVQQQTLGRLLTALEKQHATLQSLEAQIAEGFAAAREPVRVSIVREASPKRPLLTGKEQVTACVLLVLLITLLFFLPESWLALTHFAKE